ADLDALYAFYATAPWLFAQVCTFQSCCSLVHCHSRKGI
ncbi:hypothetical protein AVDCRST_MAG81-1732, partial [uncultured Synechococcales cyanobacterium]